MICCIAVMRSGFLLTALFPGGLYGGSHYILTKCGPMTLGGPPCVQITAPRILRLLSPGGPLFCLAPFRVMMKAPNEPLLSDPLEV